MQSSQNEMKVTPASLESATGDIRQCTDFVHQSGESVLKATLGSAVSRMSGLDQLGGAHGQVINGGVGSALQANRGFEKQFEWALRMLKLTGWAAGHHNSILARVLDQAGDPVNPEEQIYTFPERPIQDTNDFPFLTPVVLRDTSLAAVEANLASTDTGTIADAARAWQRVATSSEEWAMHLDNAASELASQNTGDWVDAATKRMMELTNLSRTYAANASSMSNSVAYMGQIPGTYLPQVSTARQIIENITDPALRTAAEHTYLQAFYGAYEADIHNAVPTIRNLLVPVESTGGQQTSALGGMSGQAAATGLAEATALAESSIGPGTAVSGENQNTGSATAPTHTAYTPVTGMLSGSTSTLPVTPGGPGMSDGLAGLSKLGIQPPISVAQGGAVWGTRSANPLGGIRSGDFGPTWAGGQRAVAGLNRSGPAGSGAVGTGSFGQVPGHSSLGGGQHRAGPVRGILRSDEYPGQSGTGQPGGSGLSSPGSNHGARSSVGQSGSIGGGRPGGGAGMPIAGTPTAPGASSRDSKGKVKRVTSKVEYSKNLRDLLGEPRPFIPGVIGTWVREQ